MYKYKRRALQEKKLVFFLHDTLKTAFLNENLTNALKWGTFLQDQDTFFTFFLFLKKYRGDHSPLKLVVHLNILNK